MPFVESPDQQECYEAIAGHLMNAVPGAWEKITIEFEIMELDHACEYAISYVPKGAFHKVREFFLDDRDFVFLFYSLARATSDEGKGFYKKCRFSVSANGRYKCDFTYQD